jgi:hypothetical protein
MSPFGSSRYYERTSPSRARRASVLAALVALLISMPTFAAPAAPAGAPLPQAGEPAIYVPLASNGKPGAGNQQPPPPPPPPPTGGSFFVTTQIRTNSAAIAVDGQGGMHMAFTFFIPDAENPPAVYGYCPPLPNAGCADPDAWQAVAFDNKVHEVQLALTPAGTPRLLIRKAREGYNSDEYVYAECDTDCTEAGGWNSTVVVQPGGVDVFGKDNPQRDFALDPQGRPRFVYSYGWDGTGHPVGVYYAACDLDCLDSASWSHTPMYEGPQYKSLSFDYPALTFTSAGQPRVVANMAFSGETQGVLYLACDDGCDDLSGWQAVRLGERGGGTAASWDLELDGADNPRIAFFQAGLDDGSGDRLYYLACDTECLSKGSWSWTDLELGVNIGRNADLELDAQGRPRLAYDAGHPNLLGYGWCNTQCDAAGQWQHRVLDTSASLDAAFKPAKPLSCQEQGWFDAIPALALDAAGNPRIAYDALNVARCYYDQGPGNPPGVRVEKLWRAARILIAKQP